MNPRKEDYQEMLTLLGAVRDGTLTAEQQTRINELLTQYPKLQQYYVEFTLVNVELNNYQHLSPKVSMDLLTEQIIGEADDDTVPLPAADDTRMEEIRHKAELRLEAFLQEQDELRKQQALLESRDYGAPTFGELVSTFLDYSTAAFTRFMRITTRLTMAAAVIMVGLAVTRYVLDHRVVATLDDGFHAQWAQTPQDANLHPGPMTLEQGFAKITFKQGAEILLQAPCTIDLRSKNHMRLDEGMVTAQVPEQAHGFSIETPSSTVTDFGTEFGVKVKGVKESEVHVFEGHVQCRSEKRQAKPLDITEDEAAVLAGSGDMVLAPLDQRPNLFARKLPDASSQFGIPNKRLDLSDVVGGGSGFGTGRRLHCIDPTTGQTRTQYSYGQRARGEAYAEVPDLDMIDGVFVPSAQGGFTRVSSSGYRCELPSTAAGNWWTEVAHAGPANLSDQSPAPLVLGEQVYGQGGHPALLMHANVGITFDLDAIRATLSGAKIRDFTSYCGVSNRARETGDPESVFYVIVDGQVKYREKIAMRAQAIPRVQIRLNDDNRFLTLVCLAGDKNDGDWSFFGEPALELELDNK